MKITFLIYSARSGSTFLANHIAQTRPEVVVVPEFRLPLLLMWRSEAEIRSLSSKDLRALFARDLQLDNLGLDDQVIETLSNRLVGQGRRAIILAFLQEFRDAHGHVGTEYLIKNGRVVFEKDAVQEILPEANFVEIIRDPRGVVNSMMNTRTVYSYGGPMAGGDPLKAASIWREHRQAVQKIAKTPTCIRYEDLVANPDDIDETLDACFGSGTTSAVIARKPQVVSQKEQSLHRLVGKKADAKRLDEWKSTIPPRTGMAIEAFLGTTMTTAGYGPYFTTQAAADEIAAALASQKRTSQVLRAKHILRTQLHWLCEALRRPRQVLFRLENARRMRNSK